MGLGAGAAAGWSSAHSKTRPISPSCDPGRDDQIYQVDARPSDSIALALRLNAPIFTDASLLEQGSVEPSELPPDPGLDAERLRAYLEKMDPQDFGKFNP